MVFHWLGYMRQNKTNSAQPVCRDATVLDRGTSPVTEGKTMNANWMLEEGHLVARNESGHLLRRWLADEAMGQGLALLLNHSNSLSRFLLWSLCTGHEQNDKTL